MTILKNQTIDLNQPNIQHNEYDVLVSGGGLSGLLTVLALLKECPSLKIAVVAEQVSGQVQGQKSHFDGRCIALSHGSVALLQHWGVWSTLKQHAWPIKTIVTSDRGHIGKTILKAVDFDINAMGFVADIDNISSAFYQQIKTMTDNSRVSVDWFTGNRIAEISEFTNTVVARLTNDETVSARLIVVAEGANSKTKQLLNIKEYSADYQQTAIVTNVQTSGGQKKLQQLLRHPNEKATSQNHVAFERFTTTGPIAFLPVGEQQYSVVWTETPERASELLALDNAEFCQELQKAFGFAAGRIDEVSQRGSFPLFLKKADAIVHNRMALIGNAAHTIHPIAGQGFNLGIRDVAVLVNEIRNATDSNSDIGGFETLNRFSENRIEDIDRIANFTDLLVRAFGLTGRVPAFNRTLGLMALQKIDGLQQWLAMHFMASNSTTNLPQLHK